MADHPRHAPGVPTEAFRWPDFRVTVTAVGSSTGAVTGAPGLVPPADPTEQLRRDRDELAALVAALLDTHEDFYTAGDCMQHKACIEGRALLARVRAGR